MAKRALPTISLFSGALGLDLGLEQAGFDIRVAVESNKFAAETIRRNRPNIALIEQPIEEVSTKEILKAAGLKKREPALVVGGLCCQSFSTAGQRASLGDPRGQVIDEFLRVVRETRPRFFVMENVRGMLSAPIKHRCLCDRGPGCPPLTRKEELGSGFKMVVEQLKSTGYYTVFDLLNAADFGVPQARERLLFIGSRDGEAVRMPEPTHSRNRQKGRRLWITLKKALAGLEGIDHEYTDLPPAWSRFLKHIPAGGNWRDLPKRLQREALGSAFESWGGRSGFYRRLDWDRPSPSLTTRPSSKATLLCHPTELRPLSVQEYSRIQQFPDDWHFAGGTPQRYKQIGNAVPVGLGHAVGEAIRATLRSRRPRRRSAAVVCFNEDLLKRLANRPRTILNPPRMRKVQDADAVKQWLNGSPRSRAHVVSMVELITDGSATAASSVRKR